MKLFTILALALAIGLATAASPFASTAPDGLNRVAEDHAFIDAGKSQDGPIAGYAFPGVHNARVAKGLAGFTGTLIVFGAGLLLVKAARRRPTLA
ncbi:PDGLE domain-containing protein [Solirubrobacter soli]|uniref:PDGLE domain-containing protein n=1 Tax=Solirubrobacter soli TaxID=363832 RepID=UPI00042679A6|nr:PDGLE domain-containing protein [Solirubrobacter soli]